MACTEHWCNCTKRENRCTKRNQQVGMHEKNRHDSFASVSIWISIRNSRIVVGDPREICGLEIISDQFLLLHVPFSRRSLQPPKVLVGHVTLKSISLPHRPQTHPIPLCHPPPSQHQLCHYVEPVMILSQHQIQTLLTAYHLQTSSAVQKAKCISGDVSD